MAAVTKAGRKQSAEAAARSADRERLDREARAATKALAKPGAPRGPPSIPFADRMIRPARAAEMFSISVAGLYDWIASGSFPKPRAFGASGGAVGWPESELLVLMRELPFADEIGSGRGKPAKSVAAP